MKGFTFFPGTQYLMIHCFCASLVLFIRVFLVEAVALLTPPAFSKIDYPETTILAIRAMAAQSHD